MVAGTDLKTVRCRHLLLSSYVIFITLRVISLFLGPINRDYFDILKVLELNVLERSLFACFRQTKKVSCLSETDFLGASMSWRLRC